MSKQTFKISDFSPHLFWDVDVSGLDMEKESLFIMENVFNYGRWKDIKIVLKHYGIKRIKREIVQAAYLKKTALSFLCLITGLEKSSFLSIKRRRERKGIIWNK